MGSVSFGVLSLSDLAALDFLGGRGLLLLRALLDPRERGDEALAPAFRPLLVCTPASLAEERGVSGEACTYGELEYG